MTTFKVPRIVGFGLVVLLSAALSSCAEFAPETVSDTITCVPNQATAIQIDVTASADSEELVAGRIDIIRSLVEEAALCGGNLQVSAFRSSAASSRVLFDGRLETEGATDIAKQRKVPKLVNSTMETISQNLDDATRSLTGKGTSVLAGLINASEYFAQHEPSNAPKKVVVLTDGIQTTAPSVANKDLTVDDALKLAEAAEVPSLDGAAVIFAGVGRTSRGEVSSDSYTAALKQFWLTVCERTGAASCSVVTDYTDGK